MGYKVCLGQTGLQLKIEKPINVLVRRRAAIGDVIMTTGVVRELRKHYGSDAVITVATDEISAYRNNPRIDGIIPFSTITGDHIMNSDVYINLDDAYELNPKNHYVDSYFYRAFGNFGLLPGADRSVELFPNKEDCDLVDIDLEEIGNKFIVVHMRNWHWAAKNINVDIWYEVFEKLFEQRTDFKIVCAGGSTDYFIQDHPLFFDARSKYNNQQLKYLCDHARAFVGIDSGPFQCAAASNTHIVALLTHLKPERILPYRHGELGYNCTAITTQESCAGCNDSQTRPIRQVVCQHSDYRCTSNFNTTQISDAILEQLK